MVTKKNKPTAAQQKDPIAVIGMSCIFPQAPDVKTFWQNILNGVNAVGDPLPAWEAERYLDSGRINTAQGGYLKDLFRINPAEFGIMPSSLDGGEPDQLIALQVAKRALADAGAHYLKDDYNHLDTGIVLGHSTYLHRGQINAAQHNICLDQTLEILKSLLPEMTAEQYSTAYEILRKQLPAFNADICPSEVPNVMTGRIANRLNFCGPNYLIDAACASSLLAINAAIEELRNGSSRMMLAGGVNASLPAEVSVIFTMLNALSNRGKVRPFDAESDGTLLGEGLGIVVLKRLADALEDGDRIYAVVHGVGQSSDGKGLGLLAPSEKGETLAIRRAYDSTGIDPATIGLIEAHGTGIVLGDKTEIASLKNILGARLGEHGSVAMGSVKSMISHCIPAAGMASFIKMCLSLHHKILPPTLCDNVNPELGISGTPLYINNTIKPWIGKVGAPRRAGINSFGFGGVNAHAILEEAPANVNKPLKYSPWSVEICVFAASSLDGLKAQLTQLATFLQHRDDCILLDIAYSLTEKAKEEKGPYRLALVAKDPSDLAAKITQALKRLEKDDKPLLGKGGIAYSSQPVEGKLAFLFPGEGSQYVGMLEDLATHFDVVREWFDMWHGIYDSKPGSNRTDIIFPAYSELTDERRAKLNEQLHGMDAGSEAVFIAGQAMNALLTSLGVAPDVMLGHSSGESSALVASRAIDWKNLPQLGDFIRQLNDISTKISAKGEIETGALMAIALLSKEKINDNLKNTKIVVAMENCPNQTIVYGNKASIAALRDVLVEAGAICEILPFDRGYHTPSFAPMQKGFAKYYNDIGLDVPRVPLYSCASAGLFPTETKAVRALAAEQWATTVRFVDTVMTMVNDGARYFIEVGPSGKLASFVDQILRAEGRSKECVVAASNLDSQPGLHSLLQLMAKLYVNDKAQVSPLFASRDVRMLDFTVLQKPKVTGVYLDNTMPRLHATPELMKVLKSIPTAAAVSAQAQPAALSSYVREDLYPEHRPFITSISEMTDTKFIGHSRLSVHEDCFMQDHVLSGAVSDVDPALVGLSCVPLMVTIEIMAEACAVLAGSIELTVIEDVSTFDWVALDKGEVNLEVRATVIPGSRRAYSAEVYNAGSKVMSARFLFGAQPFLPFDLLPALDYNPAPFRWPDEYEIYGAGMFHGPIFQSIPHVIGWSDKGIDAALSRVSLEGFFRDGETPKLILNPVLMDAISQLPAFWVAQQLGTDFHTFPSKIERIELYAQCPQDMDHLTLRTRQQSGGSDYESQRWDFECVDGEGQILLRVRNLHKVFFEVSNLFYQCRHDPLNGWLGAPLQGSSGQNLQWYVPYLDAEFCARSNAIFLRTLAHCLLSAEERDQWQALKASIADKSQWLFRRACIKEAARYFIYQETGELLYPSDIVVDYDENGVPYVGGWWQHEETYITDAPEVSMQDGLREVFAVVSRRDSNIVQLKAK